MQARRPTVHSEPRLVTTATLREWPLPSPDGGKESRGRTLVVGGTSRTPGAVLLAAEALLRSGAGKLQVATAQSVAAALSVAVPEAMVCPLPETADGEIDASAAGTVLDLAGDCAAVLLGPGLMDPDNAEALLAGLVPKLSCTVVVDAVGMAYLTAHPKGLAHLDGRAVLTPNQTELAITLGVDEDEVDADPLAAIVRLATTTGATVVSGGATSWVASPEGDVWIVDTGGPGLGISGSGDVKSGIITGLCARGCPPEQAAVWGTYLHGRAGDRLAASIGRLGFLARELLREVPAALAEIEV
jgi:ADP-dependent NAD(P)H-hydrate dehydratase